MDAQLPLFIERLLDASKYPHATEAFEVIQTHLSWVILTGPYVYKIKKPLSFGFQDFTTLDKRHYYCDLEVILNQRYTQGLYECVLPITGSPDNPMLNGEGEPFEYAIRIKQFKQDDLLSEVAKKGALSAASIEALATQTACFHLETQVCDETMAFGDPQVAHAPIMDNFRVINEYVSAEDKALVLEIQAHAESMFSKIQPLMEKRKAEGFVRACHGDMHLANAVLVPGHGATFFDCIEFNESFRHTDVMADVAFMMMDLQVHNRPDLANLFLNVYLEITGDYEGVLVLDYYCAYRAMVRAKIAVLESTQQTGKQQQECIARFRQHRDLAATYFTPKQLSLEITYGISGSGKTTFSHHRMQQTGAIRLRSDIERKRLAHLPVHEGSEPSIRPALYAPAMTQKTFNHLAALCTTLLAARWPVIVDAAFLLNEQRLTFQAIAERFDCSYTIWSCQVSDEDLAKRLALRGEGTSDATLAIAEEQKTFIEALTEQEMAFAQPVN